jgi:hypothetical protein
MNDETLSKEEIILRSVKKVLTSVVKDTATPPGMIHPLKDRTIDAIRDCFILISERERELAELAGRDWNMRPHYVDEPGRQAEVVVPLHKTGLVKAKPEQ